MHREGLLCSQETFQTSTFLGLIKMCLLFFTVPRASWHEWCSSSYSGYSFIEYTVNGVNTTFVYSVITKLQAAPLCFMVTSYCNQTKFKLNTTFISFFFILNVDQILRSFIISKWHFTFSSWMQRPRSTAKHQHAVKNVRHLLNECLEICYQIFVEKIGFFKINSKNINGVNKRKNLNQFNIYQHKIIKVH